MAEENLEGNELFDVEDSISKAEQFIEDNKKRISIAVGVIAVVVAGYLYYTRSYMPTKELEAAEQMYVAERYFENDSLKLALDGDGNNAGFLEIIESYGSTKSGNLANYYAGISFLKKGDFEDAIEYLEAYDGEDLLTSALALGAIGDAYSELGEKDKAIDFYKEAVEESPNEFTSPIFLMKAGELSEAEGMFDKAIDLYKKIKKDYPNSVEASKIEKYIARASTKATS